MNEVEKQAENIKNQKMRSTAVLGMQLHKLMEKKDNDEELTYEDIHNALMSAGDMIAESVLIEFDGLAEMLTKTFSECSDEEVVKNIVCHAAKRVKNGMEERLNEYDLLYGEPDIDVEVN